jgi:hypothetical protein
MSKSILITGIYRNNRTNSVGLYCGKNVDSKYKTSLDFNELKAKLDKHFTGKVFKEYRIFVYATSSTSKVLDEKQESKTLDMNRVKKLIEILNSL